METIAEQNPPTLGEGLGEENPMPSLIHSIVCSNISAALNPFRSSISIHQQLNLDLKGWKSVPDVCVFLRGALPLDLASDLDEVTIPPALVIEVLSPKQQLSYLIGKARQYLEQGVEVCWLAIPGGAGSAGGTLMVFPRKGSSRSYGEGSLRDDRLGIDVKIEDLFNTH